VPSDINEQIERRRQRGREEIIRVENKGNHPVFSLFEVLSLSGRRYRVQIRSLQELNNTCTCQDYRTNLIGTCKHIEAVLLNLKKKHKDRLKKLILKRPSGTHIYLHLGMDETIRVELPLSKEKPIHDLLNQYFDPTGRLIGMPLKVLPSLLANLDELAPRFRNLVRIDETVRDHLEMLRDRDLAGQQKVWFTEQMQKGNRSLDVIHTRLYPYQKEGALHLAFGRRAMLADDMGLGKTVQAIAAASLLKELSGIRRALIICPASLKHQWEREIRKFTSLPATVVEGNLGARRLCYRNDAFFMILNYEIVLRDQKDIERLDPDLIILDEAQRIKNWRTKTATAVKQLPGRYAFVLTGTPLENRLDELYSIFQFIDARILGPLWHYNDRFFQLQRRTSGSYKVLGYKNLNELKKIISPYLLRRERSEVLDELPERVDNNFFVEMTAPQWKAYDGFKDTVARLAAVAKRRPLTPKEREILLMSLVKMRLICNALALHDKTIAPREHLKTAPKIQELRQILSEEVAANGQKAIIFSQWSGMLRLVEPVLDSLELGHVKLTGAVPSAKRGILIERFFNDPDCRVFLSTDAGGLGLNLQAASLVINLDLPWNPAVLEQRIARAHRHGQKKPVQVINLIAQNTIEEKMLDTLAAKRQLFEGIFGRAEAPADIRFEDLGQGLIQRIDELLKEPITPELVLEPQTAEPEPGLSRPTLEGFAALLQTHLKDRLLLVSQAPIGTGILVVLEGTPADYRAAIEARLKEYFPGQTLPLHLMEKEGYNALQTFMPAGNDTPGAAAYRAPSLPSAEGRSESETIERKRVKADNGLAMARKRLALALVVLNGGFPEESLPPIREALTWGFTSLLSLYTDTEPAASLPSPRLIQYELLDKGRFSEDLAMRLSRVRGLTEPAPDDEKGPALSAQTGESLVSAVQELIDLAQQRVVELGL
jgi:SNF2 family DNA or RNA helicase